MTIELYVKHDKKWVVKRVFEAAEYEKAMQYFDMLRDLGYQARIETKK